MASNPAIRAGTDHQLRLWISVLGIGGRKASLFRTLQSTVRVSPDSADLVRGARLECPDTRASLAACAGFRPHERVFGRHSVSVFSRIAADILVTCRLRHRRRRVDLPF